MNQFRQQTSTENLNQLGWAGSPAQSDDEFSSTETEALTGLAAHLPAGVHREMFMPYRHKELARHLLRYFDVPSDQAQQFHRFCEQLTSRFHMEHLTELLDAEDAYERFDPDSQIKEMELAEWSDLEQSPENLFVQLRSLLEAAHYVELDRTHLETAIELGNDWGVNLQIDWESIDHLAVFVRGYRTIKKTRRRWQRLFFQEEVEIPIFRRMVIAFKLKKKHHSDKSLKTDCVYLKSFKDIPETDIELLLPGAHVKLTLVDRGLIIIPSLSGMAVTAYKVLRSAILFTVAAGIAKFLGWTMLIAAVGGYIAKSFTSYFRTKQKYRFGLTKNLMTKNLDNNTGVLYRLFNEAEEQELCESILAYYFLWRKRTDGPLSRNELDRRVELFLENSTGLDIDFDVDHALDKLCNFGVATRSPDDMCYPVEINRAPIKLRDSINELLKSEAREIEIDKFDSVDQLNVLRLDQS